MADQHGNHRHGGELAQEGFGHRCAHHRDDDGDTDSYRGQADGSRSSTIGQDLSDHGVPDGCDRDQAQAAERSAVTSFDGSNRPAEIPMRPAAASARIASA